MLPRPYNYYHNDDCQGVFQSLSQSLKNDFLMKFRLKQVIKCFCYQKGSCSSGYAYKSNF